MKSTVLVTGSEGFIGGYVVNELLNNDYKVVGIDNLSKYGHVDKEFHTNPNYYFIDGDAKNVWLLSHVLSKFNCEHFIMMAAMIGGISYFHEYAYDLLAENERLFASQFDAAIDYWREPGNRLKKVTILSSSMVYESTKRWPSTESDIFNNAPPISTYGFQKLATHYFCEGAFQQYHLPYTIILPFNCVGIGELRSLKDVKVSKGNINLAMSHVIPDLIQKMLKGQYPVEILGTGKQIRHYTYGGDIAKGIVMSLDNENAMNQTFNLSTNESHDVLTLALKIWKKINPNKSFRYELVDGYEFDVQKRVPSTEKAKKYLGFEATTSLDDVLDEVIKWAKEAIDEGKL